MFKKYRSNFSASAEWYIFKALSFNNMDKLTYTSKVFFFKLICATKEHNSPLISAFPIVCMSLKEVLVYSVFKLKSQVSITCCLRNTKATKLTRRRSKIKSCFIETKHKVAIYVCMQVCFQAWCLTLLVRWNNGLSDKD